MSTHTQPWRSCFKMVGYYVGKQTSEGRTETAHITADTGPVRPHPGPLKLRPNLEFGKVGGAGNARLAILHPLFLPHSFSLCTNSPSVTLAAWLRLPLLERLSHLFFYHFFLSSLPLDVDIRTTLECFPRRTSCCAFVCYRKAWFVIPSCCVYTRLTCCTDIPLNVRAVTRHISCVGGVLHFGISDSWFFRW